MYTLNIRLVIHMGIVSICNSIHRIPFLSLFPSTIFLSFSLLLRLFCPSDFRMGLLINPSIHHAMRPLHLYGKIVYNHTQVIYCIYIFVCTLCIHTIEYNIIWFDSQMADFRHASWNQPVRHWSPKHTHTNTYTGKHQIVWLSLYYILYKNVYI